MEIVQTLDHVSCVSIFTKEAVKHPLDMVYAPPWAGLDCYCMGDFRCHSFNKKKVIQAAINHFWLSQFTGDGGMADWKYYTNMGYSPEKIFDHVRPFHRGSAPFCEVAKIKTDAGLKEWQDTYKLEPP